MGESDNDMVVGELKGRLDALVRAVETAAEESKQSRLRVYNKLEQLAGSATRQEGYIESMDARLKKVEPVAEDFSRWRERGIGVIMFIGAVSGSLGAVGAVFWKKLVLFFGGH